MNQASSLLACILTALGLSGCATAGAIDIRCDQFERFTASTQPSRIVQQIQSDGTTNIRIADTIGAPPTSGAAAGFVAGPPSPGLVEAIEALPMTRPQPGAFTPPGGALQPAILLLSGGGQWGAFGAGFLRTLHEDGHIPANFRIITGVSTGGMQSMFLAVANAHPQAYDVLIGNYSPRLESDVVNRHSLQLLAGVTGALAGLKPLRRRIEAALCTNGNPALGCPMIDLLARSDSKVFIGFVKADTGELQYARAVDIAETGKAGTSVEARRNAQQCLTAVALASAAMPVFFQQIRINHETYYDGGVRQSVFEQNVAESLEAAVAAARAEAIRKGAAPETIEAPALYVIRNGPTQLLGPDGRPNSRDPSAERHADALANAFRAEAIVVNQLEVGSIAALRLAHPTGTIKLVTADGFNRFVWNDPVKPGCTKPKDVMFDPTFMRCLQAFGAAKARRSAPWITLDPLNFNMRPADALSVANAPGK